MLGLLCSAHAKCFVAFESLVCTLQEPGRVIQDQITPEDIFDEFDRYKIWAGSVGAADSGELSRESLDHRLREASSLKEQTLRLLSNLEKRISTAAELIGSKPRSYEEVEESSEAEVSTSSHRGLSEEEEKKGEENEDEDSPWEISSSSSNEDRSSSDRHHAHEVPQASSRRSTVVPTRSGPSLRYNPISEISGLIESIKLTIASLYRLPLKNPAPLDRIRYGTSIESAARQQSDILYVKSEFPLVQPQVAARLGKMITQRRQTLEFRKAHRYPNVGVSTEDAQTMPVPEASSDPPIDISGSRTTLASQKLMGTPFVPAVAAPQSTTGRVSTTEALRIGAYLLPKDANGQTLKRFECPYCFLVKDMSSEKEWRKHVLDDLQPYVCTYEDCDLYDHFFDSEDAWFNHEAHYHRTKWYCNTNGHPKCDTEKAFMSHLRGFHNQKLEKRDFDLVKDMFRYRTKSSEGTCNLCHEDSKDLQSHVSDHLKQMALFALSPVNATVSSGQFGLAAEPLGYDKYGLEKAEPCRSSEPASTGRDHGHTEGITSDKSLRAEYGPEFGSESDSDSDPAGSLREKLFIALQQSKFERTDGKKFIPRSTFDEIFTGPASTQRDRRNLVLRFMGRELGRPNEEDIALADYILESAQKVFLIAVYIRLDRLHAAMRLFKDDKFTDERLPIDEWEGNKLECELESHPFVLMEKGKRKSKSTKRIWRTQSISLFQDDQLLFLSPTISVHEQNCNFDNRRPIPFIERDTHFSSGAHGVVHKYAIHHAHFKNSLNQYESKPLVVAVKASRKGGKNVAVDVKREVDALVRMNELGQKHIVRFITSFQRGTPADLEYYVLFEWADGGNLNDFWHQLDKPKLTVALVKWVIDQLCGLAKALSAAHYTPNDASYRHGDLKPGNILWFRESGGYGTLKIGDWGEAKSHKQVTALRHVRVDTTAKYGTRRYEPPETGAQSFLSKGTPHVQSRLYDLWGMGCIILEFIIWLLYSHEELYRFNNNIQGHYGPSDMFYEISRDNDRTVRIHRVVEHWMDHMANDPQCSPGVTALGDLLQIVRTGLLVIQLPEDVDPNPQADVVLPLNKDNDSPFISVTEPNPTNSVANHAPKEQGTRLRATDLERSLRRIIMNGADERYWRRDQKPRPAPVETAGSSDLLVPPISRKSHATGSRLSPYDMTDYAHPSLYPEEWEFVLDDEFVTRLSSQLRNATTVLSHEVPLSARLCGVCKDFEARLPDADFAITHDIQTLRRNAQDERCNLCLLLWQTCGDKINGQIGSVQFQRAGSTLRVTGAKHPVLTVLRSDGKSLL